MTTPTPSDEAKARELFDMAHYDHKSIQTKVIAKLTSLFAAEREMKEILLKAHNTICVHHNDDERAKIRFNQCPVCLAAERDSFCEKAEAFDSVFTSFMRASEGYDELDPKIRWLIELPMTNEEHDSLLSAIQQAKENK